MLGIPLLDDAAEKPQVTIWPANEQFALVDSTPKPSGISAENTRFVALDGPALVNFGRNRISFRAIRTRRCERLSWTVRDQHLQEAADPNDIAVRVPELPAMYSVPSLKARGPAAGYVQTDAVVCKSIAYVVAAPLTNT